jgi:hypothetical protein
VWTEKEVDDSNANNDQYKFSECECVSVCWRLREEFVIFGPPNIVYNFLPGIVLDGTTGPRFYWILMMKVKEEEEKGEISRR